MSRAGHLLRQRAVVWGVLALLLLIFAGLAFRVSMTASEGPDEVTHFLYNRFIAEHSRLPLTPAERSEAGYKADLPPLSYLLAGLSGKAVDLGAPYLKITRNQPRLTLVTGHDNIKAWRRVNTEDPLRGEVLFWYWGRWVTALGGMLGIVALFVLLRVVIPTEPWLACAGAALLAFLPLYISVSGVTSYEPLTGVFVSLYLLAVWLIIQQPDRSRTYLAAGLLLGLAAATRQTSWPLMPVVPLLTGWLGYRQGWRWPHYLYKWSLFGVGLLATVGLYIGYILFYFNRIAQLGWLEGIVYPIFVGDGGDRISATLGAAATGAAVSVGLDTGLSYEFLIFIDKLYRGIWLGGWLGMAMLIVWLAALAGIRYRWRHAPTDQRLWIRLLVIHLALLFALPLLRFLISGDAITGMSQHILFVMGPPLIVLLIYGLRGWLSAGHTTLLLAAIAGIYLWHSVEITLNQANPPLPVQTLPLSAEEAPLATFETISLLQTDTETGGDALTVTLWWRADEISAVDYITELTLLDAEDQPQSRWLGQPVAGRYPTRAWLPGDRLRDTVTLPVAGLPPGRYRLYLRLLAGERPIPTANADSLLLADLTLSPSPAQAGQQLTLDGHSVEYRLWPAPEKPVNDLPIYRENATVLISTTAPLREGQSLFLVGPDGQSYPPSAQAGRVYNFIIAPAFARGDYRLGLTQADDVLTESPPLLTVETEVRQFELAQPPPISLEANFANYINLLGYDLPQSHLEPGGSLPVSLYWQARQPIGADLKMFTRLIGPDGQVYGGRDRVAREVYSTLFWVPAEIVLDSFELQLDPAAPAGEYKLVVGWYLPVGAASTELPLVEAGQMSDRTSITLGPINVRSAEAQGHSYARSRIGMRSLPHAVDDLNDTNCVTHNSIKPTKFCCNVIKVAASRVGERSETVSRGAGWLRIVVSPAPPSTLPTVAGRGLDTRSTPFRATRDAIIA